MDNLLLHADQNKWDGRCELSPEEIVRCLKKMYTQQFSVVHAVHVGVSGRHKNMKCVHYGPMRAGNT
jgi:hypothetical protein